MMRRRRYWVRVKGLRPVSKYFPVDTALDVIADWRSITRARLLVAQRDRIAQLPPPESFRADVPRYLASVQALTSFADRQRDIQTWLKVFQDQPTLTITPLQIRTQRDAWLTSGPRSVQRKGTRVWVHAPLAASTVNHRLRALQNMFTVLYPNADNPVKLVPEADEPQAIPRAAAYPVLRSVLAAMSDQGVARKGAAREVVSLAKVRADMLVWTGMTPRELGRLTPDDLRLHERCILVPPRRKGKGSPGRILPLTPEGVQAAKRFHHANAYGTFNSGVVRRAWYRACEAAGVPRIRLYDTRHSFVTAVVKATKDLQQGQLLAGHRDPRTTRRYAAAAMLPLLKDGMKKFGRSVRKTKVVVTALVTSPGVFEALSGLL